MFNHILKKMLKLAGDASAFAIFVGFFFSSRGWGDNWLKQMKNTGASHMGFELWCDLCLPPKHSRSYTCVICKRFCLMSLLEFCLGWAFPLWLLQGAHLQGLWEGSFVPVFNSQRTTVHGFGKASRLSPALLAVTLIWGSEWMINICS